MYFYAVFYVTLLIRYVSSACPAGWTEYISSEKCVKAVGERKTYFEAIEYCKALAQNNAGTLASVHNAYQNAQIGALGEQASPSCGYWIGLDNIENAETYKFVDGTEVDYENWLPGYPVKTEKGSAALVASAANKWESADDLSKANCFICEQNNEQNTPTPETHPLSDKRCFYPMAQYFNGSCYYFSQSGLKFMDAENVCNYHFLGHLVSIHLQEEQDFLNSFTVDDEYWTGMYQPQIGWSLRWIDGQDYPYYSNWAKGYPNYQAYADEVTCGLTRSIDGGEWWNEPCDLSNRYICKFKAFEMEQS